MSIRLACSLIGVCTAVSVVAATNRPQGLDHAPTPDRLAALITQAFEAWNVPGAAVAIVKDDAIVLAKGFGSRRIGLNEPVDEHTAFYTASVTKSFTITALGLLADEGKLRVDDRVTKFLPEFEAVDADVTRQLTLRDLMSHRTGVPRADLLMFSGLSNGNVLRRLSSLPPVAPLRTRFTYQNQMYLALGEIVSRLGGESWQSFIESRILAPLGMKSSNAAGLGSPPSGVAAAAPHATLSGRVTAVDYVPRRPYGAGGVNATARDLAQWLRFHLGDGTLDGKKIASPGVILAPQQPNSIVQPVVWTPDSNFVLYGLGWFLNDYRGRKIVQHAGNGEGWTALIWMIPQEKLGIAVLTNMHGSLFPWAIAYSVTDAYGPGTSRDWPAHFLGAERARDAAAAKHIQKATGPLADPDRWIGDWTNPVYGRISIERSDQHVELRYGVELSARVEAAGADSALATWKRTDVLAVIGASPLRLAERGGTQVLTLVLGGDALEFTRVR